MKTMKTLKLLTLILSILVFVSCDSDSASDELLDNNEVVGTTNDNSLSARGQSLVVSRFEVPNGGCLSAGTGTYFIVLNRVTRRVGTGSRICRTFRAPVNQLSSFFTEN